MDPLDKVYQDHHATGGRYDVSLFKKERGEFIRSRIGIGKKVLDIGCRDGVLTSTYYKGNDVLGVDIDSRALQHAREVLGIRTQQFNLTEPWPLESSSFDFVVAGEVLEHLYFPNAVVREARRVLKPNGVLLGSVPNAFNLKNRVRLFFGNKKGTPLSDPTHINHFSYHELKDLIGAHFERVYVGGLGSYAHFDPVWPGMMSFGLLFEGASPRK